MSGTVIALTATAKPVFPRSPDLSAKKAITSDGLTAESEERIFIYLQTETVWIIRYPLRRTPRIKRGSRQANPLAFAARRG
jgi:hypothetical protein